MFLSWNKLACFKNRFNLFEINIFSVIFLILCFFFLNNKKTLKIVHCYPDSLGEKKSKYHTGFVFDHQCLGETLLTNVYPSTKGSQCHLVHQTGINRGYSLMWVSVTLLEDKLRYCIRHCQRAQTQWCHTEYPWF